VPQACAAGLPVVATRVDGTPEVVRDGVNGFLVQPGDVGLMAEKIVYLLDQPAEAQAMGAVGKTMIAEFDINAMVHAQEDLYQALSNRH
jgi:glycosyltransferase involved in cell wall biosynthesis